MATTIITKSGSGAPLAGDLQVAELALDLTNKKLYSKEGTTVFEVGATGGGASGTFTDLTATNSFTSVGIDDNATSTAITIDSSERTSFSSASNRPITVVSTDTNAFVTFQDTNTASPGHVKIGSETDDMVFYANAQERMRIKGSNVGIGTTNPVNTLVVSDGDDGFEFRTSLTADNRILSYNRTTSAYTKMSLDAADYDIRVAGSVIATIDASGNVGIGTDSPSYQLDVEFGNDGIGLNSVSNTTSAEFYEAGARKADLTYRHSNATARSDILELRTVSGDIAFRPAETERMRIDSSGNVGIGTTSPDKKFHVEATQQVVALIESTNSRSYLQFKDGQSTLTPLIGCDDNDIVVATGASNTERMRIDSSGNVGIGETSPARHLHVNSGATQVTSLFQSTGTSSYIDFANSTTAQSRSRIGAEGTDTLVFKTEGATRLHIDSSGNLLVGTTATPTSSAGNIVLQNGTAPTASATDGVILYAEDVSSSSELKVRDEAGNITTLSPHNFDLIPQGPSEDMAWSYYSERDGKQINVDMLKAIRVLEKLSGEQLVFEN